jgi:hypothetical protein
MRVLQYLLFMLIICVALTLYVIQSTVEHEHVHQLIFEKYGIESNVTYDFWNAAKQQTVNFFSSDWDSFVPLAWTTPIITNSSVCTETCHALHTEQEIITNQTSNIVFTLFILFIFYVTYKELSESSTKNEEEKRYQTEAQEAPFYPS